MPLVFRLPLCLAAATLAAPAPMLILLPLNFPLGIAIFFGAIIFCAVTVLVAGLPAALILLLFGEPSWWGAVAVGAAISFAANLVFFGANPADLSLIHLLGVACGPSAGIAGWYVWKRTGGGSLFTYSRYARG
ncbi:hypothetical protein HK107_03210 [Parvularcula sp. ZS-1/3]|uniref:Uncharacterized protein n=1 Tax=Parvularcula mediterranea TaxID=2732508 RepID=A0A7Y3RJQ2_9PROT|nr:hypothetical protein [Parvularcula mediterranea]NNU15334.1 hypothetical protein [Parvularcula mediterranea]